MSSSSEVKACKIFKRVHDAFNASFFKYLFKLRPKMWWCHFTFMNLPQTNSSTNETTQFIWILWCCHLKLVSCLFFSVDCIHRLCCLKQPFGMAIRMEMWDINLVFLHDCFETVKEEEDWWMLLQFYNSTKYYRFIM